MNETRIEWTDRTWNPVTGCTKVSPGCDNCYAESIARRFAGGPAFPNGFDVTLRPERLRDPLKWRKPARVFVNSMSDLFHDDVPDWFIAEVFGVMAETPQHTYQILTKRPGRMRAYLRDDPQHILEDLRDKRLAQAVYDAMYPLPNVWLGVSVEDQRWGSIRIPALLEVPAAVRFLSCEPLLDEIDLLGWLSGKVWPDTGRGGGGIGGQMVTVDPPLIDWVIVGGESGPGARPMEPAWAQRIVDDCAVAGVPVFVKQLGSAFGPHKGGDMDTWPPELRVREYPAVTS